tara:strand:- start:752 stop:1069 length:318 start_codon:yes stop_codon:yes gene_type:complete
MNPGILRERIKIKKSAETRNSLGEVTQNFTTYATRYASVKTLSSKEALSQRQQSDLTVTHKIKMRYLDGLNASNVIEWRGRKLQIVSVLELDQFTIHELLCEEKR